MIPKVIHYFWFGGNPLPALAKKCIESWKRYCPDYKITEWNEDNFDINSCDYVKEAYEAKKWAFVSDYARFKVLNDYGGLYFDTDVELIKPIDEIVEKGSFMGVEKAEVTGLAVAPGLVLGVEPHLPLYEEIISGYESRHFKLDDGSLDLTTVVDYVTDILISHGLENIEGIQNVAGVNIYPKAYFNPMNLDSGKIEISPETVSIHHYASSWVDPYSLFRGKVYQFIYRVFGEKFAELIRRLVGRK